MADLAPRLIALATATGQLSARQVELIGGALATLDAMDARQDALKAILDVLDPERRMSTHALAKCLESNLTRFLARTRRNIVKNGMRPDALDLILMEFVELPGPQGKRRLSDEIKEIRG